MNTQTQSSDRYYTHQDTINKIEILLEQLQIQKVAPIEVKSVIYFASQEDKNLFSVLANSQNISLKMIELVVK